MVREIAFTAYSVSDLVRSVEFYQRALGAAPAMVEGEWAEFEFGSAAFSLTTYGKPSGEGASIGFEADDPDQTLAAFKAQGITIVPMVPEQEILDTPVCRMFMAQDPDGNRFIMHQRKQAPHS